MKQYYIEKSLSHGPTFVIRVLSGFLGSLSLIKMKIDKLIFDPKHFKVLILRLSEYLIYAGKLIYTHNLQTQCRIRYRL